MFIVGGLATLIIVSVRVHVYVANHLLDRVGRRYEVKKMEDPLFPDIYVRSNVPMHPTDIFPKDQGCFRTSCLSAKSPRPCALPYVRKNQKVANRSCLLYQGEIARSPADILRIAVDVGREKTVTTPWTGAFMFLMYPDGSKTVSTDDAAASRWFILSPKTYYLIQFEERRYPTETSTNSLTHDKGLYTYDVLTPESISIEDDYTCTCTT